MKTKILAGLMALSLYGCGRADPEVETIPPCDAPAHIAPAPDARTSFEGIWNLKGEISAAGQAYTNGDNTFGIFASGSGDRLQVVDPHWCSTHARVRAGVLEIASVVCPAWFDSVGCSIVERHDPATATLEGSILTLHQTGTSTRACPASDPLTVEVSALFVGSRR